MSGCNSCRYWARPNAKRPSRYRYCFAPVAAHPEWEAEQNANAERYGYDVPKGERWVMTHALMGRACKAWSAKP